MGRRGLLERLRGRGSRALKLRCSIVVRGSEVIYLSFRPAYRCGRGGLAVQWGERPFFMTYS